MSEWVSVLMRDLPYSTWLSFRWKCRIFHFSSESSDAERKEKNHLPGMAVSRASFYIIHSLMVIMTYFFSQSIQWHWTPASQRHQKWNIYWNAIKYSLRSLNRVMEQRLPLAHVVRPSDTFCPFSARGGPGRNVTTHASWILWRSNRWIFIRSWLIASEINSVCRLLQRVNGQLNEKKKEKRRRRKSDKIN